MASDAPPLARAKALALRALASRMRTEAQLRSRLEKAELGACADEVVAWLRRLGYLDDAAYARARARALVAPGRLGPRLAERRLRGEGVGAAQARAAIARALEDADAAGEGGEAAEIALCRALAERRTRGRDLAAADPRDRRRLARFLLGRGFAGPVVARVLGIYEDA
ncbi:MAG TPA: RecX family transcriptional regulator [Anaeromyxobacter sp.]|nr:RecX family transcriptional regulator [Anaeromyxobacter sp.]